MVRPPIYFRALLFSFFSCLLSYQVHGSSDIFFDAHKSRFSLDGKSQIFEGNVISFSPDFLLLADRLEVVDKNKLLADGRVTFILSNKIITGDRAVYFISSGKFRVDHARLVQNDYELINKELNRFREYADFIKQEKKRQYYLSRLDNRKKELQKKYIEATSESEKKSLIGQYSQILAQQKINQEYSQYQKSLMSQRKSSSNGLRKKIESYLGKVNPQTQTLYLKITSTKLERISQEIYEAQEATITSCYCREGESPAWRIYSDHYRAQYEGYADIKHAVFFVKEIPIFYLPYLRVPVKNKRQTGLLPMTYSFNKIDGVTLGIPFYWAINKESDATIDFNRIENRGFQLGLQYRHQLSKEFGWEFKSEGVYDKVWQKENRIKKTILDGYREELSEAINYQSTEVPSEKLGTSQDPQWWKDQNLESCLDPKKSDRCFKNQVEDYILPSKQDYRATFEWKGNTFLSPHWSLVSSGNIFSDHHYEEDFRVRRLEGLSLTEFHPRLFSEVILQNHWDQDSYYLGLGLNLANYMLDQQNYFGYQLPLNLSWQSPYYALFDKSNFLPIFVGGALDFRVIQVFDDIKRSNQEISQQRVHLDSGTWMKGNVQVLSPFFTNRIVQASIFSNIELRKVDFGTYLSGNFDTNQDFYENWSDKQQSSLIQSHITGVRLSVPLSGEMRLFQKKESSKTHYLGHDMNWNLIFSYRPTPFSTGEYLSVHEKTIIDEKSQNLTIDSNSQQMMYFDSESKKDININFHEQESLYSQGNITLSTTHFWSTYYTESKGNHISDKSEEDNTLNHWEQAKQELERNNVKKPHFIPPTVYERSSDTDKKMKSNEIRRASFRSKVNFDLIKNKERKRLTSQGGVHEEDLPQPISPIESNLNFSLGGWELSLNSFYDTYNGIFSHMGSVIKTPHIGRSFLSVAYNIDRDIMKENEDTQYINHYKSTFTLDSKILTQLPTKLEYGLQSSSDQQEVSIAKSFHVSYVPPSGCWSTQFSWTKNFGVDDDKGFFYLSLNINFLNKQMSINNLASDLNSEETSLRTLYNQ